MDPIGPARAPLDLLASPSGQAESLEVLAGRLAQDQDAKALQEAAEQFEGVFLNQLLKSMRATVPDNEMFNSSGPTKFYQQMYDAELAKGMASGPASLGIAELIVAQLQRPDGADGAPARADEGPVTGPPPARLQGAVARYRQAASPAAAAAARLRPRAEAQGAAVADTLSRYRPQFEAAADASGLDPALLLAVVMEESAGDRQALSHRGAQGLMQLMPGTAREMGVEEPFHAGQNLQGGARYLARMLHRYDGDVELALAAYNAGPGNVDKAGGQVPDFPETRRYVQRVLERLEGLGGGTELDNSPR